MKRNVLLAIVMSTLATQQFYAMGATFPGDSPTIRTNTSSEVNLVATVPDELPVSSNVMILLSVRNCGTQNCPAILSGTMGGFRFSLQDPHGRSVPLSEAGSKAFYSTVRSAQRDSFATWPLKSGWERWMLLDLSRFVAPLAEGDYGLTVSWEPNATDKVQSAPPFSEGSVTNVHVEIAGIPVRLRRSLTPDLSDMPRTCRNNIAEIGYTIGEAPTAMKPLPRPPEITEEMEKEMLENNIGTYEQLMAFRRKRADSPQLKPDPAAPQK